MPTLTVLLLSLALTAGTAAIAPTGADATKVRVCGNLTFTKNTEDVAWNVRASGVSCRAARRVVKQVRGKWPSPSFDGATSDFSYRGWWCHGVERDLTLPQVNWKCTKRSAWIRFKKT